MLAPNAVLRCGTESARRRHAAHGQTCAACDKAATNGKPAAVRDLQLLAENRSLRQQVKAVSNWTRLLADNKRLNARLNDADQALTGLLAQPVIRHEAVDRIHRHLFPARKGRAS